MADRSALFAESEAERLRRQRAMLFWLGERALRAENLDQLFEAATSAVAEATEGDVVQLLELLPGQREMLVRAALGLMSEPEGPVPVGAGEETPSGYALLTAKPVVSTELAAEKRFALPARLRALGMRSLIDVVIEGPAGRWGLLEVAFCEDRPFDQDECAFLQSCADLVAAAIDRLAQTEEKVPCPYCAEPVRPEAVNWPFPQAPAPERKEIGDESAPDAPRLEELDAEVEDEDDAGWTPPDPGWYDRVELPRVGRRRIGTFGAVALALAAAIFGIWWVSGPEPKPPPGIMIAVGPPDAPGVQGDAEAPAAANAEPLPGTATTPNAVAPAEPQPPEPAAAAEPPQPLTAPDARQMPPLPPQRPGDMAVAAPGAVDSASAVRSLQSDLALLGYDVGPIDGRLGPLTHRAITSWQRKHREPGNGDPTEALRRAVHAEAIAAVPARFR